jgi:hypothetical protein
MTTKERIYWRLLNPGENVPEGAEYFNSNTGTWEVVASHGHPYVATDDVPIVRAAVYMPVYEEEPKPPLQVTVELGVDTYNALQEMFRLLIDSRKG